MKKAIVILIVIALLAVSLACSDDPRQKEYMDCVREFSNPSDSAHIKVLTQNWCRERVFGDSN